MTIVCRSPVYEFTNGRHPFEPNTWLTLPVCARVCWTLTMRQSNSVEDCDRANVASDSNASESNFGEVKKVNSIAENADKVTATRTRLICALPDFLRIFSRSRAEPQPNRKGMCIVRDHQQRSAFVCSFWKTSTTSLSCVFTVSMKQIFFGFACTCHNGQRASTLYAAALQQKFIYSLCDGHAVCQTSQPARHLDDESKHITRRQQSRADRGGAAVEMNVEQQSDFRCI